MVIESVVIEHAVVEHFERVAPLIAANFAGIPLVAVYYPQGLSGPAVYSGPLHHDVPPSIETVECVTSSGPHRYVACATNAVEWLAHRGAVELCSWAPDGAALDRCKFARILVHPSAGNGPTVERGLQLVRERLKRDGVDGVALRDIRGGAIWIPVGGRPTYGDVAAWLHGVASDLLAEHADIFSVAPLRERNGRLYLGTATNHPGRFSALPYSAIGEQGFPVMLPQRWDELAGAEPEHVTVANFPGWLEKRGDLFKTLVTPLAEQRLPKSSAEKRSIAMPIWIDEMAAQSRGVNIRAAIAVLADGRTRSAEEIVADAVARGLLHATTPPHQFYVALIEYIARARGMNRVPQIVQLADRRFRINEPADDWPEPTAWRPTLDPAPKATDVIEALRTTGRGHDPVAFERAVCAAFEALGFTAHHVGGQAAPDGYVDAPLGSLAYRAMLECKTARADVAQPDAAEAVKYRDAFGARYAALVGPSFPNEQTLASELQTHSVSAWTIDDLAELLAIGANSYEIQSLFAPGFVADRVSEIRWAREHGQAKRVAFIGEALRTLGRQAQIHAGSDAVNAPHLTTDAAMLLVDADLATLGIPLSCSREDVEAAFAFLTSPLIAAAVWETSQRCSVVLVAPEKVASVIV